MKVYFVRHGESEANALNVHQGSDGDLSERGIKQAEVLAERLRRTPIDFILSSPYERAHQTANIINDALQKEIAFNPLLKERRHPSEIVGKNPSDPESMRIRKLIDDNYAKDSWKFSDEETFYDLRTRALAALEYIAALNKNNILVVTHGAFLRFLICTIIFGEDVTPRAHKNFIAHVHGSNTGLTVCKYSEGRWWLLTWNDLTHLE